MNCDLSAPLFNAQPAAPAGKVRRGRALDAVCRCRDSKNPRAAALVSPSRGCVTVDNDPMAVDAPVSVSGLEQPSAFAGGFFMHEPLSPMASRIICASAIASSWNAVQPTEIQQ